MKNNNKSSHWAETQVDVVAAAFQISRAPDKSSERYLSYLLELKGDINSAVDLGCGLGIWLNTAKSLGVETIRGYDIPEISVENRKISKSEYIPADLSKKLKIDRRFDLAMSVEVAEHINKEDAETFVESLTNLSDIVMFGAAIPYQGGMGHVNENWLEYWALLFKEKGYRCYDIFRQKFWHDPSVIYYYKQNTLLFVKKGSDKFLKKKGISHVKLPQTYIHPDMYIKAINRPLPSKIKSVWEDVAIYYDYILGDPKNVQDKKQRIYGDKHLGWANISKEFADLIKEVKVNNSKKIKAKAENYTKLEEDELHKEVLKDLAKAKKENSTNSTSKKSLSKAKNTIKSKK